MRMLREEFALNGVAGPVASLALRWKMRNSRGVVVEHEVIPGR